MDDVPATNESESPPAANDTEVPTAIPRTRRGLISRRPMNVIPDNDDLETPSAISSNRRRKLSLSSDDDDQSSSQAEDIHEKPQKVTDVSTSFLMVWRPGPELSQSSKSVW